MKPKSRESIFYELNFGNKIWVHFTVYRQAESLNGFEKHAVSLSKVIVKYDNILIMDGFDTDVTNKIFEYSKPDKFFDLFNFVNLIKSEICFTNNHKSMIYFM